MAIRETFRRNEALVEPQEAKARLSALRVENILCPVGFSEFSFRAFHYAASIARHFQARLFVQHTVHPSAFDIRDPNEALESDLQEARKKLERMIAESRQRELVLPEVVQLVNWGNVDKEILRSIERQNIDLLALGTHGRRGFERLMPGSLAERIVHETSCPVLILSRPQRDFIIPEDIEPVHLKTVLLTTDLSDASDRALAHGLHWAAEWSAEITVLHVAEDLSSATKGMVDLLPEHNPDFDHKRTEIWEKVRKEIPPENERNVTFEIRSGKPKEQILQMAEERKADLIVMGARELSKWAVPWGSTVSEVIRDGRFPVLVVRQQ